MVRKAILINQTIAPARKTPRLAGLPLLLRAALSAQRAGVEELLVVGGDDPEPLLARDPRLHLAWGWIPVPGTGESEMDALRAAAGRVDSDFLLLFADSIFEARAAEALAAAPLEERLLLAARPADTPEELEPARASLYLCSSRLFSAAETASVARVASLYTRLRAENRSAGVALDARLWPRTTEPDQLRAVYRELAQAKLKPWDGLHARFNKLVLAEPLLRLFLRTPASANFVTFLGLVFGVASGIAFAQGGYRWGLAAAALAFVSSMMDNLDGMVARLKMQESEFGVWFESAVDYASYFCMFVGLAVGLYRETGERHHLFVGALFVLAAVISFVLQSRQRRQVSGDNPADFARRIYHKLDQRDSNFFHWFARKFHFLTRRAVLPYYILLFCLLNLRVLLLGWVTFGANLVWILTLYNNRLLSSSHAKPSERAPRAPAEAD